MTHGLVSTGMRVEQDSLRRLLVGTRHQGGHWYRDGTMHIADDDLGEGVQVEQDLAASPARRQDAEVSAGHGDDDVDALGGRGRCDAEGHELSTWAAGEVVDVDRRVYAAAGVFGG